MRGICVLISSSRWKVWVQCGRARKQCGRHIKKPTPQGVGNHVLLVKFIVSKARCLGGLAAAGKAQSGQAQAHQSQGRRFRNRRGTVLNYVANAIVGESWFTNVVPGT